MTLWDRISLFWRYGKGIFLVGALYNGMCAGVQAGGFSYAFMVDAFILKTVITAVTVFLAERLRDRDAIFFYINLGLSRRRLLTATILADYLVLAILMTVLLLIHG